MTGTVEGIYVAPEHEAATVAVERARVVAGRGPEGDRHYAAGEPNEPGTGHDLTLIEAEAVEALASEHGIELAPGDARRNIVTRGVALNDLVGRPFRVGAVRCIGVERCDPCRHLERLTKPGVLRGLVNRGGLSADIVEGGEVAVGDVVEPI